MTKNITNTADSIKQKLINISRQRGDDPNLIFIRYTIERLLYRIGCSKYKNQFILKGAMLFAIWTGKTHRPTKDLDLLGFGDSSAEKLISIFTQICNVKVQDDGLEFISDSIEIAEIRKDFEYPGQSIKLQAKLGNARINIHIDIGFGDIVVPKPIEINYPTLLNMNAPKIRAYPIETVVSEKCDSIISRGILNSRMKDFYDLMIIAKQFTFDGKILAEAITKTLAIRGTVISGNIPIALTEEFYSSPDKQIQWKAFLKINKLENSNLELSDAIQNIEKFLMPVINSLVKKEAFSKKWIPQSWI